MILAQAQPQIRAVAFLRSERQRLGEARIGQVQIKSAQNQRIQTALELLDSGHSVLLMDAARRRQCGGQANDAFGCMLLCNTPEQRRNGIQDSAQLLLDDWCRAACFQPDDVWAQRWAEAYAADNRTQVYGWQLLNWRIAIKELAVSGTDANPLFRDRKLLRLVWQTLRGNRTLVRELITHNPDVLAAHSLEELAASMAARAGDGQLQPDAMRADIQRYDAAIDRGPAMHNDDQLLRLAAEGQPVLVDVRIDYSKCTRFTEGVVKATLARFTPRDKVRVVGRALWRRVTG